MRTLYSIAISIYSFLLPLAGLFNRRARKLSKGQRKALKKISKKADPKGGYVWFHAASLGEFEQGRPLMEKLKREKPETKIILTFYSPSGYEVRKNYKGADIVAYLPADTPANARRFMKIVKPSRAVFIKYEFWPNYLTELSKAGVPVISVSAIFRKEQLFFNPRAKWYLSLLSGFSHIFVQDNNSLKLLQQYGITNASVCGDTRFDRVVEAREHAMKPELIEKFVGSDKVIVAGSTWPADEELLVRYSNEHPEVKMIIVPHEVHKTHLYDVFKLLQGNFVRYSEATDTNIHTSNRLVIDAIGLLSSIYQYANVAYIGGGFGVGIHNTLEAAVYDVPVVFGPNWQKFREAQGLIECGGATSIQNYEELKTAFDKLIDNDQAAKAAGDYVRQNTGATDMVLKALDK